MNSIKIKTNIVNNNKHRNQEEIPAYTHGRADIKVKDKVIVDKGFLKNDHTQPKESGAICKEVYGMIKICRIVPKNREYE
jgi:hypothetical protein